jgi:hypothetical protein
LKFALLFAGNDKVREPAAGELGARVKLKVGATLFKGAFEGTAVLFNSVLEGTVSIW